MRILPADASGVSWWLDVAEPKFKIQFLQPTYFAEKDLGNQGDEYSQIRRQAGSRVCVYIVDLLYSFS